MKSTIAVSALLSSILCLPSTSALRIPFERRAARGSSFTSPVSPTRYSLSFFGGSNDKESIGNVGDIRYTTNVTVNGHEVLVALDTGSTDLWVLVPDMGTFNDTGIPLSLLYGDGTYGVEGTIGVSPFEFGPYKVEKQAFLSATTSTIGALQDHGINGVFGLSFEIGAASPINDKIKALYGDSATWGSSVLQNIFDANPTEPNIISLQLGRTGDLEGTGGGEFLICEYNTNFTDAIENATQLDRYPQNGDRWTTLVDGLWVDDQPLDFQYTSNVPLDPGIPSNATVALLDTGDPTGLFPSVIADAIFSRVPGAYPYVEDGNKMYILPCNTTTNLEISIGGVRYPVHPLDLSTISNPFTVNGQDYITCISSFTISDTLGQNEFDMILGDTFLRNVYSVYDFGDPLPTGGLGTPYMKLVSTLDPAKAIQQVATIRGQTLAGMPPEMDPAQLITILTGNASPGPGTNTDPPLPASSTDITGPSPVSSSPFPSPTDDPTNNGDGNNLEKGGNSLLSDLGSASSAANIFAENWPDIKKWGYLAVGLLGLNALIGIVLLIMGCMMCIRKGGRARSGPPAVSTMGAGYGNANSNRRSGGVTGVGAVLGHGRNASVDTVVNTQYTPIKQDEAFGTGYPQHHQQALPQYYPTNPHT